MSRDLRHNRFTTTGQGLVPAPGTATGLFLRDDGTWAAAGGSGGGNVTPDTHPATPNTTDDEFEFGSTLDTAGARFSGATPWTWVNQHSAVVSVAAGSILFTPNITASADVNIFTEPLPVGNCTYVTKMVALIPNAGNGVGLTLYETGSGKLLQFILFNNSGNSQILVANGTVTGLSIVAALPILGIFLLGNTNATVPLWLQAQISGTNIIFSYSLSGLPGTYGVFGTYARATYFTAAPNAVALGGESQSVTTGCAALFDYLRRTA